MNMGQFSSPGVGRVSGKRKQPCQRLAILLWLVPITVVLIACDIQPTSAGPRHASAAARQWGTSDFPFAVDSPWNSRPVNPVLGGVSIPPAKYSPAILANGWSTGVFVGKETDLPATVRGHHGSKGLWNPDDEAFRDVTIPHWPSDVEPATKSDGHAEIVDPVRGIVHSFWQLRRVDGQWTATQYAWTSLQGRGWGDPAHYFQGARATGVPTMAGLIRKHEVDDGAPMYRHALAMSLTDNALSPGPAYIFPATSADAGASRINRGSIPEGALMMLPPSFDAGRLSDARIRKIAETLKTYGAYVVDRNDGTPFVIYAEIGSGLDTGGSGWNRKAAADLELIRSSLRQVVSAENWQDALGRSFVSDKRLNLLSMRGPWHVVEGGKKGVFDSWTQSVRFPSTSARTVQVKYFPAALTNVYWAKPVAGSRYLLSAATTGGAKLRLRLTDPATGRHIVDSGEMSDGGNYRFAWPNGQPKVALYAIAGIVEPSSVRADLRLDSGAQEKVSRPSTIRARRAIEKP